MTDRGQAKVLDFGLTKVEGSEDLRVAEKTSSKMENTLLGGTDLTSPGSRPAGDWWMRARICFRWARCIGWPAACSRLSRHRGSCVRCDFEPDPKPIEETNPAVPPEFGRILSKLLEKDRLCAVRPLRN